MEASEAPVERFESILCLRCLGDPEHIKEHDLTPWIPTEEDIVAARDSLALRDEPPPQETGAFERKLATALLILSALVLVAVAIAFLL